MSVFKEVTMSFDGETYAFTPSMMLLRRIEANIAPSSLTDIIVRVGSQRPPVSEIAFVAAEFLRAAGAENVSDEMIYAELINDMIENDGTAFGQMCEAIVAAITPPKDIAKKSPPSRPKVKGKRRGG